VFFFPVSKQISAIMTTIPITASSPLPITNLAEIATSGALDEISNAPGQIRLQIKREGLVKDGITHKAVFFLIYQTTRYGPQNGFRLCLVHEGFRVGDLEKEDGDMEALSKAEEKIEQGAMEFIRLGTQPPAIQDP
jgi:hypothetical protein